MKTEVFLLAVEVMYLWRALPCCSKEVKEEILARMNSKSCVCGCVCGCVGVWVWVFHVCCVSVVVSVIFCDRNTAVNRHSCYAPHSVYHVLYIYCILGLDVKDGKAFQLSLRCLLKGALLVELGQYHEAERVSTSSSTSSSCTNLVHVMSQVLREALRYESEVKQDKHIFSFSMYELAVIQIKQNQVSYVQCYTYHRLCTVLYLRLCTVLYVPQAVYSAIPQAVYSAIPQAVYSAIPQAVCSAIPQAVYSAIPQAVYSAIPQAVYSAFTFAWCMCSLPGLRSCSFKLKRLTVDTSSRPD